MASQLDRLKQSRVELLEQWNEAQTAKQRKEEEWEQERVSDKRARKREERLG